MNRAAGALRQELRRSLGPRAAELRVVVEEARLAGAKSFLVGGPVRDLLLSRPVHDVDVLLSGELERVARSSARRLGVVARVHTRFLTATLEGAGFRLDLSRARRETYAAPGALPRVRPADIEEDLPRRDFSVNTMALPLDAFSGRELVDPLGGCDDLERRRLRVLHDASFRDDPTRLLRAARYAARLRFRIAPSTRRLASDALDAGWLDRVSGERVFHEIERLLDEAEVARTAAATERLGLFEAIRPGWSLRPQAARALARLDRAHRRPPWPAALDQDIRRGAGLRLLLLGIRSTPRVGALERLGQRGRVAEAVHGDLAQIGRLGRTLARRLSAGRLDALLSSASDTGLLAAYCALPAAAARQLARFPRELRARPGPLDGHEAGALGARGPEVGRLLRAARSRALDGQSVDAAWAQRWLARQRRMR